MDPFASLYLTGLAGYWIFRRIQSLAGQQPAKSIPAPLNPPPYKVPPTRSDPASLTSSARPQIKVRNQERSRSKYCSASTLFASEYVSYSRLRYYYECPHKFRLAYLDGHREVSSTRYTGEGVRFHEQCESYFSGRLGHSVAALRQEASKGYMDSRLRFSLSSLPSNTKVIAAEHKLGFTLRDTAYFGIVDFVGEDEDGITRLVDFKTGKSPKPHLEQLELYCLPALLSSTKATIRCSFILVDARDVITWEVGPHNRNEVIGNLIRRVNQIRADLEFKPFISSKCKDCSLGHVCKHRHSSPSSSRRTVKLTSAKRGAENRKRLVEETRQKIQSRPSKRPNNSGSFFAVRGRASWICDETRAIIKPSELHYTTRKGHRLSVEGFKSRFPGVSFPDERKRDYGKKSP